MNINFKGLIANRKISEISGPEFINALKDAGWKEGTGTHFFQQLRKDGPSRGIHTPAELSRAVSRGRLEKSTDGKTLLWVCNDTAYIVLNENSHTLITFSQGKPKSAPSPGK